MQKYWAQYVQPVHDLCEPDFWSVYDTVRRHSGTCADAVLKQVRTVLQQHTRMGHRWPSSNRTLRNRVSRCVGDFWEAVTYTHTIDLRHFGLANLPCLRFTFLDPVYVWIMQCETLIRNGSELVWTPKILTNPTTKRLMYGAGIEYGLLFQSAKQSVPAEGDVALINLSWDGGETAYKARSACPICVQVMNTNSGSADSVGLVAYMPKIEVACRDDKQRIAIEHYVLQVIMTIFACICPYLYCILTIFGCVCPYLYFSMPIFACIRPYLYYCRRVLERSWNVLNAGPSMGFGAV